MSGPRRRRRRWPRVLLGVVVLLVGGLVWVYLPYPDPEPVPGNGPVAAADEPWVVAIGDTRHADVPSGKSCVGTLVAPTAVVTAAHCLGGRSPAELTVIGGRTDLRGTEGRQVAVADLWTVPGGVADAPGGFFDGLFARVRSPADIGLVLLAEPLPGRPLPMATAEQAYPPGGSPARVSGWRVSPDDTPVLWQSPSPIVDDRRCRQVAADARRAIAPVLHGYDYDPAAYLCAGGGPATAPRRPSDSGSPLVVDGHLVGVTAWSPVTDPTSPGYYARVGTWSARIGELVAGAAGGRLPR